MYITDNKTSDSGFPDLLSLIEGEDIQTDRHGNNNEMFHTPNFGEEDFSIPLNTGLGGALPRSQEPLGPHQGYTPIASTVSAGVPQTFILPASLPYQAPHMMDIGSGQRNRTDCSILETLESIAPKFPPQNFDVPDISVTNSLNSYTVMNSGISTSQMYGQPRLSSSMNSGSFPLTTISQTDISSQLGFQTRVKQMSPSNSTNSTLSPVRESSEDSDDSLPLAQLKKRQVVEDTNTESLPAPAKKQRTPKKRKKKDPNEPQKPVSAYALFFRDTQVAIKGQNPNASFGEVSKIVASMWEGLDPEHKNVYKKKTEQAKKEYLKQLAAYRASLVSQAGADDVGMMEKSPSPPRQSPMAASPQHLMAHLTDNMGYMNNNSSPQHMTSPQRITSPQQPHMSSPPHNVSSLPHPSSSLHTQMMNYNNHQQVTSLQQKMPLYGSQLDQPPQGNNGHILAPGMCIRNGCTNRAIDNIGWDSEYCSNECVVSHCRDVFTAWVASRQTAVNSFQVK